MKNKYNAKKQIYKGNKFDSKKELTRYLILESMEKNKYIFDLELHPVIPLIVNGIKIGRYTADFKYKNKEGEVIIEDVKSKHLEEVAVKKLKEERLKEQDEQMIAEYEKWKSNRRAIGFDLKLKSVSENKKTKTSSTMQ